MTIDSPERVVENLRKQLSVAVRSVQWSYAIFWSLSTTKQGVLEWGDGYYNGDVKTRKIVPTSEVNAEKLGLRRSEQLSELYESLLDEESELRNTNTRESVTLCPEDLSDLEWYYLVCMSFTFKLGQSLPGKAFASGQPVWLFNALEADSKYFTRSLLARVGSIFPSQRLSNSTYVQSCTQVARVVIQRALSSRTRILQCLLGDWTSLWINFKIRKGITDPLLFAVKKFRNCIT